MGIVKILTKLEDKDFKIDDVYAKYSRNSCINKEHIICCLNFCHSHLFENLPDNIRCSTFNVLCKYNNPISEEDDSGSDSDSD